MLLQLQVVNNNPKMETQVTSIGWNLQNKNHNMSLLQLVFTYNYIIIGMAFYYMPRTVIHTHWCVCGGYSNHPVCVRLLPLYRWYRLSYDCKHGTNIRYFKVMPKFNSMIIYIICFKCLPYWFAAMWQFAHVPAIIPT